MSKELRQVGETPAGGAGLTVIFKGLNKCNAGCTFCCIGDPAGKVISWEDFSRVADELEELIRQRGIGHLTFTFHGGEPTLLGAELLDRMCQRIKTMPVEVWFNLQSNLLAVSPALREVFVAHKIKVGTSVDPLGLDRVDKNGKSAFGGWLANYLEFAKDGEPPGAIYVVTRTSLGRARQIYAICEAIGTMGGQRFAMQINPVYAQGKASDRRDEIGITAEEFGEFLVDMWREWEANRRSISLTPIQSFAGYFRAPEKSGRPRISCTFQGNCAGSHVGIDYDLNVAGCGRRLDSRAFIGNLRDSSLVNLFSANAESRTIAERAGRLRAGACAECRFFHLCHGGCPDDAWLETGEVAQRHSWCAAYRRLFETMEQEIGRYRQPAAAPPARPRSAAEKFEILVLTDPAGLAADLERPTEVWLLPDAEGKWLRFDSRITPPTTTGKFRRLRLWCHNRHVKSLVMWEDLLRTPGVSVVLFEAEGLSEAMNVLNALRALIILDVPTIVKSADGATVLHALVKRFTGDPLWHSQVLPFRG